MCSQAERLVSLGTTLAAVEEILLDVLQHREPRTTCDIGCAVLAIRASNTFLHSTTWGTISALGRASNLHSIVLALDYHREQNSSQNMFESHNRNDWGGSTARYPDPKGGGGWWAPGDLQDGQSKGRSLYTSQPPPGPGSRPLYQVGHNELLPRLGCFKRAEQ